MIHANYQNASQMITCFGISLFKFSTCVPSCQYFWAEIPMYSPILGESNEEYCLILVWRSNAFLHEQSYVGGVCSGIKGSWIHFVWFFWWLKQQNVCSQYCIFQYMESFCFVQKYLKNYSNFLPRKVFQWN